MIQIKDDEIYFAKIKEDAVIPSKKDEDAGYDMYACFDGDFFVIEAGESKPIPTGISIAFSKKYYAQIEERSSMAKMGIKKNGGVFDSGYRGEYLFVITKKNIDELGQTIEVDGKSYKKDETILYPATKAICQVVLQVVPELTSKEITYEQLKGIKSERGEFGFGSSGK